MCNENMTAEREAAILEGAVEAFGEPWVYEKAIEKLIRLSATICEAEIGRKDTADIREALAEVLVLCDQLELIFGDVTEIEVEKLEHLERQVAKRREEKTDV